VRTEPTPLAAILAERIHARGLISFAEYMEACLYHPEHGYYSKENQQPRRDYFTSVDVSPIFGRLLARQFHQMWILLGRPNPFWLVEAGAGTGALAKQVLDCAADSLGEFYAALHYVAVERSIPRRAAQSRSLASHATSGRVTFSANLPGEIEQGCVFSNELLDAMPVHRLLQENDSLSELYVAVEDNKFREQAGPISSPALADYFTDQGICLQDQQQAEVCLEASRWIEEVAGKLRRGFVLTVDYGHTAKELYNERHMRGTLLAYARHRASEDYLRAPGDQDLTAHVNFTALKKWGLRGGLLRTGFTSQSNFLLALARHTKFEDLQSETMNEEQKSRARLLFKTLIYPEGMGETFQVLVQHKGIESPRLAGFDPL
jgi:SAM-dependent MidA family methyltransferase